MNKRLRVFSLIGGLALLAAIFALSGCSSQSPMESSLPQVTDFNKMDVGGISAEPALVEMDQKLITADAGGEIEIARGDYVHKFEVEPGAISEDTEITVKTFRDKIGFVEVIVFEFGPDGLVFAKAATLEFQIAELNAAALSAKLFYFDPDLKGWVYQGSSAVKDGVAEFPIYHFSKYAISD